MVHASCRPAQPRLALTPAPAPGWACSMSTPDPGAVQTLHALSLPHCPLCPARPNVKTLLPPPRPESFSEVSSLGAASYTGISALPQLVPGWLSRHARPTPASHPRKVPLPPTQAGGGGAGRYHRSLEADAAVEAGSHAPHTVPRPWHFSPRPHGILNRQGSRGETWGMSNDIPQLQALKSSNRWGLVPGGRASSQVCTLTMPARVMA